VLITNWVTTNRAMNGIVTLSASSDASRRSDCRRSRNSGRSKCWICGALVASLSTRRSATKLDRSRIRIVAHRYPIGAVSTKVSATATATPPATTCRGSPATTPSTNGRTPSAASNGLTKLDIVTTV
jgi:hypothetical protein